MWSREGPGWGGELRSEDLSWSKYSWLPSASWLSLSVLVASRRRYRRSLCFHIWARIWQGNDMLRDPPPAAATLSICHASDNNVLSPQACSNTCWRDQLLANACNKRSPRVRLCPENWPKLMVNISSVNPAQIPPIWLHPLFPALFPPFTHYLHISFSWLVSFYSLNKFFFCFLLYSFAFPLASLWQWQAETCVWGLHKYCAYTRDNVRAWMWPSCVKFESVCRVYRYVSPSVIMRSHRDYWLAIAQKPLQTTALCSTSTRSSLHLDETRNSHLNPQRWNDLFTPVTHLLLQAAWIWNLIHTRGTSSHSLPDVTVSSTFPRCCYLDFTLLAPLPSPALSVKCLKCSQVKSNSAVHAWLHNFTNGFTAHLTDVIINR